MRSRRSAYELASSALVRAAVLLDTLTVSPFKPVNFFPVIQSNRLVEFTLNHFQRDLRHAVN